MRRDHSIVGDFLHLIARHRDRAAVGVLQEVGGADICEAVGIDLDGAALRVGVSCGERDPLENAGVDGRVGNDRFRVLDQRDAVFVECGDRLGPHGQSVVSGPGGKAADAGAAGLALQPDAVHRQPDPAQVEVSKPVDPTGDVDDASRLRGHTECVDPRFGEAAETDGESAKFQTAGQGLAAGAHPSVGVLVEDEDRRRTGFGKIPFLHEQREQRAVAAGGDDGPVHAGAFPRQVALVEHGDGPREGVFAGHHLDDSAGPGSHRRVESASEVVGVVGARGIDGPHLTAVHNVCRIAERGSGRRREQNRRHTTRYQQVCGAHEDPLRRRVPTHGAKCRSIFCLLRPDGNEADCGRQVARVLSAPCRISGNIGG